MNGDPMTLDEDALDHTLLALAEDRSTYGGIVDFVDDWLRANAPNGNLTADLWLKAMGASKRMDGET